MQSSRFFFISSSLKPKTMQPCSFSLVFTSSSRWQLRTSFFYPIFIIVFRNIFYLRKNSGLISVSIFCNNASCFFFINSHSQIRTTIQPRFVNNSVVATSRAMFFFTFFLPIYFVIFWLCIPTIVTMPKASIYEYRYFSVHKYKIGMPFNFIASTPSFYIIFFEYFDKSEFGRFIPAAFHPAHNIRPLINRKYIGHSFVIPIEIFLLYIRFVSYPCFFIVAFIVGSSKLSNNQYRSSSI